MLRTHTMVDSKANWQMRLQDPESHLQQERLEMFRDPVPWEALGLVDHLSVEDAYGPGHGEGKAEQWQYMNEDECVADIRLIWHNAMLYNVVYVKAKSLSEAFESQWALFASTTCRVRHATGDD